MTIKGLSEFLRKKNVPKSGRKDKTEMSAPLFLGDLKGKKIAIEAAGLIYRQNWAAVKNVIRDYPFVFIQNKLGIGHWSCPSATEILDNFKIIFRNFVKKICDSGIIPVFIIEGSSPDTKSDTVQKRIDTKQSAEAKVESLSYEPSLERFKEKLVNAYPPTYDHKFAVIDILNEMEINMVQAKYEAEGVCAYLVKTKVIKRVFDPVNNPEGQTISTIIPYPYTCDAALINDFDIFAYGCNFVIRNLQNADAKNGHFEVEGYVLDDILRTLEFLPEEYTPEQRIVAERRFRLLCILSGTDYSDNIHGFGPAKIHKLILKHNIVTYDDICKVEPKFQAIPYHQIIETMKKNQEFEVIRFQS